ncbi:glycosyltransferase [Jatrophihabitans endophyticus]|uniref:glycosyltransferase n=1 Tax=Jatrophihabitans endophyticus TaxID=1206085 RepID=UPI0019ED165B|nr:glycosyltransferase [Jatrophihabitans endophyticus]MBE7190373.1 glycosyltransferase [Jatrophihabitans endophyticus]
MPRRRIAVIGPSDAIVEPFSGGLAAHVWALTAALQARGHDTTLFAAQGSDPGLPTVDLSFSPPVLSEAARSDVSMPSETFLAEHHAYLTLMLRLAHHPERWDVVHNHSLHYLPIAMARSVAVPMVTTLHTPPTPWLESAFQAGLLPPVRFAAVSAHTAAQWQPLLGHVEVIPNGIDCDRWRPGPGGDGLAWSGRITPEKAPHLAVDAARRTGRRITLAGPVCDRAYFDAQLLPRLGPDVVYAGHLVQSDLSRLLRESAALVVSPVWDEPYGLVVAEALASGTPVAAFRRGGIPEVVDDRCAALAEPDDVDSLAAAIDAAVRLDRRAARRRAERHCSVDTMVDRYEDLLFDTVAA